MKRILVFAVIAALGFAQYAPPPGAGSGGFVYTGVLASIPATCTIGQVAFITDVTPGQNQYNCTATNTWTQNLNSGSGGASTALSNLAAVSINTALLPQTGVDLGSTTKPFQNLYLSGSGTFGTNYFKFTGTPSGTRTITIPDVTGTLATTANLGSYCALAGCTMTGPLNFTSLAGTGSDAYINFPSNTTHSASAGDFWNNTSLLQFNDGTASRYIPSFSATTTTATFLPFATTTAGLYTPRAIATGDLPTALANQTSVNGTTIPSSQTLLYSGSALGTPSSGTATNIIGLPLAGILNAASGQISLATSAIGSGACQTVTPGSVNSVAVTSLTTAAIYGWNPSGSIKAVTGYTPGTSGGLSIVSYVTAGNINWDVCNWESGTVTPGAVTLNWYVLKL